MSSRIGEACGATMVRRTARSRAVFEWMMRPEGERIDLGGDVSAMCMSRTGAHPVRPHMIAVNPAQTHAIVSFVATGHVLFIDADTREAVECLRTSPGAGGVRQAHMATPSPDGTYVTVANQNGKLFERISTDYDRNIFLLDPTATIDLANCATPAGLPCQSPALRPDNAPICPITESSSRFTFVTLRGGGLFVVDSQATPMQIVGEYDQTTVMETGVWARSRWGSVHRFGGRDGGEPLSGRPLRVSAVRILDRPQPPERPCTRRGLQREQPAARRRARRRAARQDRYLWVADRGRNFLWVVDTRTDQVVDRIQLVNELSADPTPDLLSVSPDGTHVFMSLRGPIPLTADPHVSTGTTPGIGVLKSSRTARARSSSPSPGSRISTPRVSNARTCTHRRFD